MRIYVASYCKNQNNAAGAKGRRVIFNNKNLEIDCCTKALTASSKFEIVSWGQLSIVQSQGNLCIQTKTLAVETT